MSKPFNYSGDDWQAICQGKAIPPDMRVNESLPEYLERKFQSVINDRNELLGLLREASEVVKRGAARVLDLSQSRGDVDISVEMAKAASRIDAALERHKC